ncbi:MAG: radical SAM protein [Candidatus Nanoarchaeia archaeon]|nr:radical SAM protein [Candidatus Nanoarchaeia archaeon]
MKILLIHPHWMESYGRFKDAAKQAVFYPPLGLMYIGTLLEQKGNEVKLIDAEAEGKTIDEIINEVNTFNPDLIGITSTTPIYHKAKELAKKIKEIKNIPIVLGGAHACVMLEKVLEDCKYFDYVVYGEGEHTTLELLEYLKGKKKIETIKGLIYRKNEKIIKNPTREFLKDLDSLPLPDRSLIKTENYLWSVPKKGIVKIASIQASRGCPFNCIYCSQRNVFGKTIRFRKEKYVLAEIENLVKNYDVHHIVFLDDNLTLNKELMKELSDDLIKKNLNITWEGSTRANLVDEEILTIMKKAGLVRLSFGIESGNEDILKVIKKGVNLTEIKNAFRIAKKLGIETKGSVMIGLPTETKKEIMNTLHFIEKLDDCDQVYLNITTPYPGTELYDMAVKGENGLKLLSNDFSTYKRYGDPVMEVNGLKKKDLINLQRKGFLMFYLKPKRIYYNLKRAGPKAAVKNVKAFIKSIFSKSN